MYTTFDVLAIEEGLALATVLKDRERYRAFLVAAETYAAEHNLIAGGEYGIRLLLGSDAGGDAAGGKTTEDLSILREFYSSQAPTQARAIGTAMYAVDPDGLGHYTSIVTRIGGYHLVATVDGRDLVSVYDLPVHRGVATADLVLAVKRPAMLAGAPTQLLCMRAEIQLLGVYAALCNPSAAGRWPDLLEIEPKLRDMFLQDMGITGGAGDIVDGGGRSRPHEPSHPATLWSDIRDKFATGPGRVLVGPEAIRIGSGGRAGTGARLQVVAVSPVADEAEEVAALAKAHGISVTWGINTPRIPSDSRMERLTVYVVHPHNRGREPILDIYNCGSYEAVPYRLVKLSKNGPDIKIGTPFLIMRFRLVDLWTIRILEKMNVIKSEYARAITRETVADFVAAAAGAAAASADSAADLLPVSNYVGRATDAGLALKRAAQASGNFYKPYYPAGAAAAAASAAS